MSQFLSLSYWFNVRAGSLYPLAQNILIGFILILVIIYISAYIYAKRKGLYLKISNRLKSFTVTNFIIGIVLLFFTYEGIPFLSARFWFLFWGLGMLVWIGFIVKQLIEIPKLKEQLEKEREYKKYIP